MYRDIKKLGKGGSASVYEVERISDGKLFAAKIISKSYLDLKEERKNSLINEISLLRAL
jgi:serine/threonine protein kinase